MRSESSTPVPFSFDTWISAAPACMPRRTRNRGSIVLMYMLILSTLITGAVASFAVLSNSETQSTSVGFDRDQAFYAAEAGIQRAIWNINHNSSAFTSSSNLSKVTTGTLYTSGPTYSLSCITSHPSWPSTPLNFQCVGTSSDGTVTSQASVTITSSGSCPGFAIGGQLKDNGNITVAGNVWAVGSVSKNGTMIITNATGQSSCSLETMGNFNSNGTYTIGSAGPPIVTGNLLVNGTISNIGTNHIYGNVQASAITYTGQWNVTGSTTKTSPNLNFTAPSFTNSSASIYVDVNSLVLNADQAVTSSSISSSKTIDFTAIKNPHVPGNPIIVVTSDLSLNGSTIVKGSGTLVVEGGMSINGSFKGSSGPAQCNIVTSSDSSADNFDTNGTINIQGALCINGSLNKNGSMTVNGVAMISGDLLGNGSMTMSYVNAPWFIHSGSDGRTSTITVSNFMGPMY